MMLSQSFLDLYIKRKSVNEYIRSDSTFVCDIQVFLSPPQKDVEIKQNIIQALPDEDVEEGPALVWDGKAF